MLYIFRYVPNFTEDTQYCSTSIHGFLPTVTEIEQYCNTLMYWMFTHCGWSRTILHTGLRILHDQHSTHVISSTISFVEVVANVIRKLRIEWNGLFGAETSNNKYKIVLKLPDMSIRPNTFVILGSNMCSWFFVCDFLTIRLQTIFYTFL